MLTFPGKEVKSHVGSSKFEDTHKTPHTHTHTHTNMTTDIHEM